MYTGKMTVEEYRPEWRDALRSIHMATASEHARTDEKHGRMSLALYCDEYLDHETVYVLLDEERIPRGYILCAEDAMVWAENMAPYIEEIKALGPPYDRRADDTIQEYQLAYEEYPAHLHIDILEEYTGNHHGSMLMEALLARLKKDHVRGVCLGASRSNVRAIGFYRHFGFQVLAEDEYGCFFGLKL